MDIKVMMSNQTNGDTLKPPMHKSHTFSGDMRNSMHKSNTFSSFGSLENQQNTKNGFFSRFSLKKLRPQLRSSKSLGTYMCN